MTEVKTEYPLVIISSFQKRLYDFVKYCDHVCDRYDLLTSKNKNPISKELKLFMKMLSKLNEDDYKKYFEKLHTKHIKSILLGPFFDKWLDGSVNIKLSDTVKFPISNIYNNARKVKELQEESINSLPLILSADLNTQFIFMEHLYKLFYEIEKDNKYLDFLQLLKTVMDGKVVVQGGGDLSEVISTFTNKLGIPIPKEMSGQNISEVLKEGMNNPMINGLLGKVTEMMKTGNQNPEELLGLVKNIMPGGEKIPDMLKAMGMPSDTNNLDPSKMFKDSE